MRTHEQVSDTASLSCGCAVGSCACDVRCSCAWRRHNGGAIRGGFRRMLDRDCPIHGPDYRWFNVAGVRRGTDT